MAEFNKAILGRRIKSLREERGMNQSDLAKASGINDITLSRYETGSMAPGAENLWKLADALECSIDVLAGRVPLVVA